ncbi:MAG: alpha/beta hydrolase [Candidatus Limnocylindrales bacterium]
MTEERTTGAPIILVPGFWLGGWAWDEVADMLRKDGHDVTALTLPGMASNETDRSSITFTDHVDAIVDTVLGAESKPVLAVHSAAGFSGYAASDRGAGADCRTSSTSIRRPGRPPLDPEFDDVEKPLDWKEIEAGENLDGLTEEQMATFRDRAVPVPGAMLREGYEFTNDARLRHPVHDHRDGLLGRGLPEVRG